MPYNQQLNNFFNTIITNTAADLNSALAKHYKKTIPLFEEEAVYIYSLKEKKLLYADGWEKILGYKDNEITMFDILNSTIPKYAPFSKELNYKVLLFIYSIEEELEKYSFSMELKKLHKNGNEIPITSKVGVHQVENNKVISIRGLFTVNYKLRFGNLMQYDTYGPERNTMEAELDKNLFYRNFITKKEKEALTLVVAGKAFKEIAHILNISVSAVDKRIIPLYKRFNVNGLAHLVSYAYENHIVP